MSVIKELYRRRTKQVLKGLLFTLVIPDLGLAFQSFADANKTDREIKKLSMVNEEKPDRIIICSRSEINNDKTE